MIPMINCTNICVVPTMVCRILYKNVAYDGPCRGLHIVHYVECIFFYIRLPEGPTKTKFSDTALV